MGDGPEYVHSHNALSSSEIPLAESLVGCAGDEGVVLKVDGRHGTAVSAKDSSTGTRGVVIIVFVFCTVSDATSAFRSSTVHHNSSVAGTLFGFLDDVAEMNHSVFPFIFSIDSAQVP